MTPAEFDAELERFNAMCRAECSTIEARRWNGYRGELMVAFVVGGVRERSASGLCVWTLEELRQHLRDGFGRRRDKPSPDAPREVHRRYADRYGYFWLPCPRCGREFGGHEGGRGTMADKAGDHWSTCCPNPETTSA